MKRRGYYRNLGARTGTGMHCWYCGKRLNKKSQMTRDHQTPLAHDLEGWPTNPDNLVLCCKACNNRKGCRDVEGYRAFLMEDLPQGERVIFYGESNTC